MDKRHSIELPDGGHATFTGKPTKETLDALNTIVQLAKKNLKVDKIDYKAEVLKVYPDVTGIILIGTGEKTKYYITSDEEGDISDEKRTTQSAWKSAYQKLKQQGKL